jgi:hypothetical protein
LIRDIVKGAFLNQEHHPHPSPPGFVTSDMARISMRTATMADVEAIVRIAVDVIPQEPQVLYQYPYMDEYPEDCYRCTTAEITGFIENASPLLETLVMVAEAEDEASPSGKTIIAHTVWDLMATGE